MDGDHISFYQRHKHAGSKIPQQTADRLAADLIKTTNVEVKEVVAGEIKTTTKGAYYYVIHRSSADAVEIFVSDDPAIRDGVYKLVSGGQSLAALMPDKNAN